MKTERIICWQLDLTLRPTMKREFDIIPAQTELIGREKNRLSISDIPKFP